MSDTTKTSADVLGRVADNPTLFLFDCPGCGYAHHLETKPGAWTWNGDLVKPTANPSLLINKSGGGDSPRCHLFISEGKLRFLADCTHDLAGQTVNMKPF